MLSFSSKSIFDLSHINDKNDRSINNCDNFTNKNK